MLLKKNPLAPWTRRDLLRAGLYGIGVSSAMPGLLGRIAHAQTARAVDGQESASDRILVVVELAGGNDGLNTVVPYSHDTYYELRPQLAIPRSEVLRVSDDFGFHPACTGLESLFKEGKMAIVNGCGYPNPNLSHFTAMGWWHSGVPHGNEEYGWLGRYADADLPTNSNTIVNVASKQSPAVASAAHSPVVFDDPERFGRFGTAAQQKVFETFGTVYPTDNASLDFVNRVSKTATTGAASVRNACAEYRSLVDYGSDNDLTLDLKKVAAMIAAELPTRIYYVQMGGFDTHAAQAPSHNTLMIYMSDAIRGFMQDIERLGRADDVGVMVFTEFGRRVAENASGGTDHGTATPMFVLGSGVEGGFYGRHPDLDRLDDGNLEMTTDFRRVYATMLDGFMGYGNADDVLKGDHEPLPIWKRAVRG